MNAHAIAKHYDRLTPEERFRLILAADERDDETEQRRLHHAGKRILLSTKDHWAYVTAFDELAMLTFVELLDHAASYLELLARAGQDDDEPNAMDDLARAAGYVLKAKAEAWNQFCERLNVPPTRLWDGLPGIDRIQRARELAEMIAFDEEETQRWLVDTRPADDDGMAHAPMTVNGLAEKLDELFRRRVTWWGG